MPSSLAASALLPLDAAKACLIASFSARAITSESLQDRSAPAALGLRRRKSGRSQAFISGVSSVATVLSITFDSSLAFPGQSCLNSNSSASAVSVGGGPGWCSVICPTKWRVKGGISSRLSLKGGMCRGTTLRR